MRYVFSMTLCIGGGALMFYSAERLGAVIEGPWIVGMVVAMIMMMFGGSLDRPG